MLDLLQIAFMCSVIAYVYAEILMKEKEVLYWWHKLLVKWFTKTVIVNGREETTEHWAFRPLGGCAKCFSGQLALWTYLIIRWHVYSIGHHVFVISMTILLTIVIGKIVERL